MKGSIILVNREMAAKDRQKQINVMYLDGQNQWQQYGRATLHLDLQDNTYALRIVLKKTIPPALLPILPTPPLLTNAANTVHLQFPKITNTQKMGDRMLCICIEEWARVLLFSFRDDDYCDLISEQLELNTSSRQRLPCAQDQLVQYVAEQLENNQFFIDIFFNSEDIIATFVRQAEKYQNQQDSLHKRTVFKTLKLLLLRADKQVLITLLKEQYYPHVLLCLSYNYEFGDRRIDYPAEYNNMIRISNILKINKPQVLRAYHEMIKSKFLVHVATSMFINQEAQVALNEIVNQNSLLLLQYFGQEIGPLSEMNQLAQTAPVHFIQLFAQLWEMFKSVADQAKSITIKRMFKNSLVSEDVINTSFRTMKKIIDGQLANGRLVQQFLEALNPFLSHKWKQSQEILLFWHQKGQPHILGILLDILPTADYNTKAIVLLFAKNLVEVTQLRPQMKQSFLNYFYNQFVTPCVVNFTSTDQLQILMDFFIKLYKMDLHRTRRAIMQSELLLVLEGKIQNKYILMLILKLLRFLLESKDTGLFGYMGRRNMFTSLRYKYFQTKKYNPNGIISSLFVGLIKDSQKTQNKEGQKLIHNIMFPNDKVE